MLKGKLNWRPCRILGVNKFVTLLAEICLRKSICQYLDDLRDINTWKNIFMYICSAWAVILANYANTLKQYDYLPKLDTFKCKKVERVV